MDDTNSTNDHAAANESHEEETLCSRAGEIMFKLLDTIEMLIESGDLDNRCPYVEAYEGMCRAHAMLHAGR